MNMDAPKLPRALRIRVEYFAILREERGAAVEELDTTEDTPAAVYEQLRARHGFSLDRDRLQVVVNESFTDWDHALTSGDTVVFIPPVAGG